MDLAPLNPFNGHAAPASPVERALPYNIEAEQAVLGAFLSDNQKFDRLAEIITADDFYEPLHRIIFEKIVEVSAKGFLASPVTVGQSLGGHPAFDEVGGTVYLSRLAGAALAVGSARAYAQLVHALALRRSLIQIADEVRERALDNQNEFEPHQQIQEAESELYALAEKGQSQRGFENFTFAIKRAVDIANNAYQRSGHLGGLATGFRDLDKKLGGLYPSDLIILAARPGMGKTSLATNIAFNVAKRHKFETDEFGNKTTTDGGVVGFFSLEMASEQLALRVLSEQAEIASEKIRKGEINADEFRRFAAVATDIERIPLYIDQTGSIPISTLAARARRLKRRFGLDLIVIDYLQLMTTSGKRRFENRVQEITEITQGLKTLAKELDVPIIALSQLSRAVEQRDNKRPMLADLRESGSIEQDADIVLFIYREEYYLESQDPGLDKTGTPEHDEWMRKCQGAHGIAEILIEKHRHGPTGNLRLQFTREYTRFGDLDYNQYGG